MQRRPFHIEPVYKSFVWAGSKLSSDFHLDESLGKVGTIYCVIALPGELDNIVSETGQPLSEFYVTHGELFGCSSEMFPVRMTITCNEGFQSYQLHPDDEYALRHEGCRGKVSGAVALDGDGSISRWLFGHRASSPEEFRRLIELQRWDDLFTTLEVHSGDFVHTPAGVIHGGWGDGTITATFGTNSDITYRFYDNGRNDPSRPLSVDDVCRCVHFPEVPFRAERPNPEVASNLTVFRYHDVDGEYVATRLEVRGRAEFPYEDFLCLSGVKGRGSIEGVPIEKGETLLVPRGSRPISLEGDMDCIAVSYHDRNRGVPCLG